MEELEKFKRDNPLTSALWNIKDVEMLKRVYSMLSKRVENNKIIEYLELQLKQKKYLV